LHLAEVSLAWQSGKMPEKNEQDLILEAVSKRNSITAKIHQGKPINRDFFHQESILRCRRSECAS
jgi:hypothetical protein